MNKEKEVEVVDSREAKVDLMEKVVDLTISCKIKAILNGKMMTKTRSSGKVVVHTKAVLGPTEEEVILTLEVVSIVNVIDVVKMVIDPLNARNLEKVLVEML